MAIAFPCKLREGLIQEFPTFLSPGIISQFLGLKSGFCGAFWRQSASAISKKGNVAHARRLLWRLITLSLLWVRWRGWENRAGRSQWGGYAYLRGKIGPHPPRCGPATSPLIDAGTHRHRFPDYLDPRHRGLPRGALDFREV